MPLKIPVYTLEDEKKSSTFVVSFHQRCKHISTKKENVILSDDDLENISSNELIEESKYSESTEIPM